MEPDLELLLIPEPQNHPLSWIIRHIRLKSIHDEIFVSGKKLPAKSRKRGAIRVLSTIDAPVGSAHYL